MSDHQIEAFLLKLGFDPRWAAWGMYPPELYAIQHADWVGNGDDSGEHFRYGAVQWWLDQKPTPQEFAKLVLLCHLDADSPMRTAALRDIEAGYPGMTVELEHLTGAGVRS
jgi:hypothetical protein